MPTRLLGSFPLTQAAHIRTPTQPPRAARRQEQQSLSSEHSQPCKRTSTVKWEVCHDTSNHVENGQRIYSEMRACRL